MSMAMPSATGTAPGMDNAHRGAIPAGTGPLRFTLYTFPAWLY